MQFKRFDPKTATNLNCVVILGKRSVGKTILVKNLLLYMNCPSTTIFNSVETLKSEYCDIIPYENIHEEYSESKFDNLIKQKKDQQICIVFDNCIIDCNWWKQRSINYMFLNGRCIKTKNITVMQYPLIIPPRLRTNIDYIFIFNFKDISSRKRLYDHYANIFETFEVFCQVLDNLGPFECIVINQTALTNNIEDQVMFYTVPSPS